MKTERERVVAMDDDGDKARKRMDELEQQIDGRKVDPDRARWLSTAIKFRLQSAGHASRVISLMRRGATIESEIKVTLPKKKLKAV